MVDFAVEPLLNAQSDIESMLPAQWAHTGDTEVECRPNWALYRTLNEHNGVMVVMAREYGRPVGYLAAFIYPHPNAVAERVANIPTYFVEARPARALIESRMVDFTLKRLAAMGIFKVSIETSAEHSAGRLWELKGFKLDKIGYTMKLKPKPETKHA